LVVVEVLFLLAVQNVVQDIKLCGCYLAMYFSYRIKIYLGHVAYGDGEQYREPFLKRKTPAKRSFRYVRGK
jgi:hypothetical protein